MKSVQIRSFFWPECYCIWTEYGDLWRRSLYSVQIQENTELKKLHIWTLFTQCKHEKLQYDMNREAAKISTLSSRKTDEYEYLTRKKYCPLIKDK